MTSSAQQSPDDPGADTVSDLNYEQAREELVAIVHRLESGGAALDESLALWERGERLAAHCEQILTGAANRVAAARSGASGDTPDDTPDDASDDEV